MTHETLTAEECERIPANMYYYDANVWPCMIIRLLATVAALRAEVDKREAMRQTCYDKWQKAEDKLAAEKATTARYREALRSVRIGLVESHEAEGARLRSVMFIDLALADEPKAGTT